MNIKDLILQKVQKEDSISAADIVKATGFSRGYISRFLKELRDEGKIILIGKANRARYVRADRDLLIKIRSGIMSIAKNLKNVNLSEDTILDSIKRESGVFINLKDNVSHIIEYAFTELLNNAIEHSESETIKIGVQRTADNIRFDIIDYGIGIFYNIMKKKNLKNELEAIQDLLKGKQTTAPREHSGEGIFFTSKVADSMIIEGGKKKLIFNNIVEDIFIQDIRSIAGTRVIFNISLDSKKELQNIFSEYAGDSYEFSQTSVAIKLYKMGLLYISRSQARRVLTGLEKFKTVVLDFKHIKSVGQSFADEIFRVWKYHHPKIEILIKNTNDNIDFMINRAKSGVHLDINNH